jgi:hypothetical protein
VGPKWAASFLFRENKERRKNKERKEKQREEEEGKNKEIGERGRMKKKI